MSFYTSVNRLGNNILYTGYNDNGVRVTKKIKYGPTLFVADENSDTEWKSLDGRKVRPINFNSMSESRDYISRYGEVENFKIYGDISPICQFITELYPDEIHFDMRQINVFNFDIEAASDEGFPQPERHPVISITAKSSRNPSIYHVWGMGDYDTDIAKVPEGYIVRYVKCKDEKELLMKFIQFWSSDYPDILTGWFIRLFDIPYLVKRITVLLGEEWANKMSPWGKINYKEVSFKNKKIDAYEIFGIQQMDYFDVFQKFGYSYGPQENYSLDHISHVILGERKLSYEEYGSLNTLYKENYQKFIDYNIRDVMLVDNLDKETGLLELALIVAYKGGVNFSDTFGTTGIWDSIIYRYLNKRKIAIPPTKKTAPTQYAGGYVKEPIPGFYESIMSFDLNSLYPNLIVQYNISPETLVKDPEVTTVSSVDHYLNENEIPQIARDKDYAVAANGSTYHKRFMGVLPSIIVGYYDERKEVKGKMIDAEKEYQKTKTHEAKVKMTKFNSTQMAIKILLNSLYGALGNSYFRYYDILLAEGVTMSGQLSIRWAEKAVNEEMNKILKSPEPNDYVIAIDTDSLYVDFKELVDKVGPNDVISFLDKVASERFEKVIAKAYDKLFHHMNANLPRMEMAREVIADRGIWTAKKRYILRVHDKEGVRYDKPKLKIMGIEAVKSSTPAIVRAKFKEAYAIILDGDESKLQEFVKKFENEFCNSDPEDVAFPRGVSDIDKWRDSLSGYKKGTPIHVRASLMYNMELEKHKLTNKYELIKNGSKIKYLYLKMPNPIRENVIAFTNYMPREFPVGGYIDYDKQFDKAFKQPLKIVTDCIGWQLEKIRTLDEFF